MVELQEIFEVSYGVNLELNKLNECPDGINFVSRTAKNNGVSAKVEQVKGIQPIPAGTITVAGGGSVLETFLQSEPYYSGRDLYYLAPKQEMTLAQKLYYCACIRANKYRYSYGRQANRTLRQLLVPSLDELPSWLNDVDLNPFKGASDPITTDIEIELNTEEWQSFEYQDLFDIQKGSRLTKANMTAGNTPFIGSTDSNNGLTNRIGQAPLHKGNVLTLNYNGSVGECFYQPVDFWASDDVNVLYPRETKFLYFNAFIALFLIPCIKMEKYRFNYGRKWHTERMKTSVIKLPVTDSGELDLELMENYIKTLPFSSSI